MTISIRTALIVLVLGSLSTPALAEIVFSSAPRGSVAQEQERYGPFVKALSGWLGEEVVYVHPKDFTSYAFAMRRGEYDLVLDGPHLVGWRMSRLNHEPIVKLPRDITFLVVAHHEDRRFGEGRDELIARQVCGLSSPHLGTLQFMAQYENPMREPSMVALRGGFKRVFAEFKQGKCDAALLRNFYYNSRVSEEDRNDTRVVYTVPSLPDQALTASPRLSPEQKQILRERLTDPTTAAAAKGIFKSFAPGAEAFVPADPEEYRGLEQLLIDATWGWN